MSDILMSSHTDMLQMKAKGRSMHRRVQSNTAFDMNALLNTRPDPNQYENLIQTHNIIGSDATQRAIDASKNIETDKEVIVDDIDEIPNMGYIIPKSYTSNSNNPLSFIKKRTLSVCTALLNNTCPVKKIDLLTNSKQINDLTGLNTIYERRNSIEELETEQAESKSSEPVSRADSRNNSKNPSQQHSRKSSQALSKNSSQSQIKHPGHSKQSSTDLRSLPRDNNTPECSSREQASSNGIMKNQVFIPTLNTDSEFMQKRNKFIQELQRASAERRRENSSPINFEIPSYHARAISNLTSNQQIAFPQNVNKQKAQYFLNVLDKSKLKSNIIHQKSNTSQTAANFLKTEKVEKDRRESFPASNKWVDGPNRVHTPTNLAINLPKSHRELNNIPSNPSLFKDSSDKTLMHSHLESKVGSLDETVQQLSNKTNFLEEQVRNLSQLIDSINTEKVQLELKMKDQDIQIRYLQTVTSKYEEEIQYLKSRSTNDSDKKSSLRYDISSNPLLNTTEGSILESPYGDRSATQNRRESKGTSKTTPFSVGNVYGSSMNANSKKTIEKPCTEYKTSLKKIAQHITRKSTGKKNFS